jgi:hypothetical protein
MATLPGTHPLAVSVRESNRQGRGAWGRFAPHRARVMELLLAGAAAGRSLALLGPGNLNDVDLPALSAAYGSVLLADIDRDSVALALERRPPAPGRVVLGAPQDLTGLLHLLAAGRPSAARVAATARDRRLVVPGAPFDVTASTGLLTQMLGSVHESALDEAEVDAVALAVRDAHLRDLVALTRPGGRMVLVTDVVATTTAPELLRTPPDRLEPAMAALVAAGNFFTGVNPYRIVALLEEDRRLSGLVEAVELRGPWLWAVTADRRHLTCAVTARRTLGPAPG